MHCLCSQVTNSTENNDTEIVVTSLYLGPSEVVIFFLELSFGEFLNWDH